MQILRERLGGLLAVVLMALVVAAALTVLEDWWWKRCQPYCPSPAVLLGLFVLAVECVLALPLTLLLPRRAGLVAGIAVVSLVGLGVLFLILDGTNTLTYCGDVCF